MNKKFDEALYHETEEFQRVELPFGNGSFSMIVALPKEGKGLSDLLSDSRWMSKTGLQPAEVVLLLPKFKIENGVSMKEALQEQYLQPVPDLRLIWWR